MFLLGAALVSLFGTSNHQRENNKSKCQQLVILVIVLPNNGFLLAMNPWQRAGFRRVR